jgi:23S rRNA (cytidine2498-2'-O)-methyltransferase
MEAALKLDLVARHPRWRLAYSRPGLVTCKLPAGEVADERMAAPSVFARVWGASIGQATTAVEVLSRAPGPWDRIHVFARDPSTEIAALVHSVERDLATDSGEARAGDRVLDVVVAADEPLWLGSHVHSRWRAAAAGGLVAAEVPADSPSRAYAKIEEAIAWAALPMAAGQVAVEIGSAPGGAALALARRGIEVVGVDAAQMAPEVMQYRHSSGARVTHLAVKVGALRWEDLPPRVDWLLVDVNLAPQVALHEVARLMPRLGPTLRGAVVTLKLNELGFVRSLALFEERLMKMGFSEVHMTHLPSNRQEVCAVALMK